MIDVNKLQKEVDEMQKDLMADSKALDKSFSDIDTDKIWINRLNKSITVREALNFPDNSSIISLFVKKECVKFIEASDIKNKGARVKLSNYHYKVFGYFQRFLGSVKIFVDDYKELKKEVLSLREENRKIKDQQLKVLDRITQGKQPLPVVREEEELEEGFVKPKKPKARRSGA